MTLNRRARLWLRSRSAGIQPWCPVRNPGAMRAIKVRLSKLDERTIRDA